MSRYSLDIHGCYNHLRKKSEMLEKFIRELHGVASHVNTSPNALGRLDNHKINFQHRQLHPSVIGKIDLLDSSKDVGQTGMISPWSDVSTIYDINKADLSKYKNIRYDLFDFIRHEFPEPDLVFHVNSEKEYNDVLDRLLMSTYMKLNYGPVNPSERSNE